MVKKIGRPSSYTPDIAREICERLAAGDSLMAICRDDHMPHRKTVHQWVLDDLNGFRSDYAIARDLGVEQMADSLTEISDDGTNDWVEKNDPDNPGYVLNGEHVQRSKLRVDTRKWLLAKRAPKKYGDKTSMELTGSDGGPVQFTDTEMAAKISAILAVAQQRKVEADVADLL